MMGLPTETEDEIKETISMLKIIDPDYYSPSFFTPHPGSDLYEYGNAQGSEPRHRLRELPAQPDRAQDQGSRHRLPDVGHARIAEAHHCRNRIKRSYRKFSKRYLVPSQWPAKVGRRVKRLTGNETAQTAR